MLIKILLLATHIHATSTLALNQPVEGCSSFLEFGKPVLGRWRLDRSRIAPLRLQEALLRLPQSEIFELMLVNRTISEISDVDSWVRKAPSFDLQYWIIESAHREGRPDTPIELLGARAKPEGLISFLASVPIPYETILIDPQAVGEGSREEFKELSQSRIHFVENVLASRQAYLLGRLRH